MRSTGSRVYARRRRPTRRRSRVTAIRASVRTLVAAALEVAGIWLVLCCVYWLAPRPAAMADVVASIDRTAHRRDEQPVEILTRFGIPALEIPAREIPAREIPAREIPAREIPAREIPARVASEGTSQPAGSNTSRFQYQPEVRARGPAKSHEPQQGEFLFAATDHNHRGAGQVLNGQHRIGFALAAVVDVRTPLFDGPPGFAFALGQRRLHQGVDQADAALQRRSRQFLAGDVGEDLLQLGVGQVADLRAEEDRGRRFGLPRAPP